MFFLALLLACTPTPVRHAAILVDQSGSLPAADECGIARALTKQAFDLTGVDSRSDVLVLATGDGQRTIVELARVEMPIRASGDRVGQANLERQGALLSVAAGCAAISHPETSPIYASIRDSLVALRALGCSPDAPCTLLIASDMQETQERGLRARLAGKAGDLPAALDTAGIEIQVCGVGTTNHPAGGKLDADLRARTEEVWQGLLGGAVRFTPQCTSLPETGGPT